MTSDQANDRNNNITVYIIIQSNVQRYVSAAVYNQRKRIFQLISFSDNQHYSNLEALIIQINPKQSSENFKAYVNLRTDIKSEKKKILEKINDIDYSIQDSVKMPNMQIDYMLEKLLIKAPNLYMKDLEDKKSLSALQRLLSVLKLEKDTTDKKQIDLQTLRFQKHMRMDKAVINALQIFPKNLDKKVISGTNTLYQILNKCKTNMGVRCLKRWMKQPLQNSTQLNQRLDKVQFFIKNPQFRNIIHNQIKKIPDLDSLYHVFYKVEAGKKSNVEVNDLIKIYRTIKVLVQLVAVLEQKGSSQNQIRIFTEQLTKNLNTVKMISRMVEDNIILQQKDSQCHVRPDASEELTSISKKQNKIQNKIDDHVKQIQSYLGVSVSKILSPTHKFILQAEKKKSIEKVKQNSNYKFLTTKQTKITFITNTMTTYCKQLNQLQNQYRNQEKGILKDMYKVVAGYYTIMQQLSKILSEIDVLIGFSALVNLHAGANSPWCRPQISTGKLYGQKLHHPCVYQCVPNDFDIGSNKTVVLTGPNMGGKSTFIRTIGISVYLAHLGCYVPARHFQTPIIDSIITRVGASDMQLKGISTFMSQMIESSCMLHSSTSSSLVLIDQLGRGTSTAEGFGIAWGICHQLHTKINPYCLFATHFHEMTTMSDQVQGVCNMYTECNMENGRLNLQYRVLPGKMLKSYGIQVARMLDFPRQVVIQAQTYLSFYQNEDMITDSELQIQGEMTKRQKQAIRYFKQMKTKISLNDGQKQQIEQRYKQKIKAILSSAE